MWSCWCTVLDEELQDFSVAVLCSDAQRSHPMLVRLRNPTSILQQELHDVNAAGPGRLVHGRPLLQTHLLHQSSSSYQIRDHLIRSGSDCCREDGTGLGTDEDDGQKLFYSCLLSKCRRDSDLKAAEIHSCCWWCEEKLRDPAASSRSPPNQLSRPKSGRSHRLKSSPPESDRKKLKHTTTCRYIISLDSALKDHFIIIIASQRTVC